MHEELLGNSDGLGGAPEAERPSLGNAGKAVSHIRQLLEFLAVERRQEAWLSGSRGVMLDKSLNASISVVRI